MSETSVTSTPAPKTDIHAENALLATILLQEDPASISDTAAKGAAQWRKYAGLAPHATLPDDADGRTLNGYLLNRALRKAASDLLDTEDNYAAYCNCKVPTRASKDPSAKIAELMDKFTQIANAPANPIPAIDEAITAHARDLAKQIRDLGHTEPLSFRGEVITFRTRKSSEASEEATAPVQA